jgi:ParB family chromosome partitioning protein
MTEIKDIGIAVFDPNPYQPETRIHVGDDVGEQYGKSILQHGLLQIPLARVSPTDPRRYQMGDGWLRLTGYRWLVSNGHPEFDHIACEVRELSNEQMAHLVFEANGVRKDLNPIETATYFQKYVTDFKVTEAKLAEIHGLSQGEVANTMRLLQLPADVQKLVADGTVPQTHARHLIRLNKVPEVQAKMVKDVVKGKTTVNQLSNDIEVSLWQRSKSLNKDSSESFNRPVFDVDTECRDCEHVVDASYPYGNRKKERRCLNTECWEKKEAAATAEMVKKNRADIENEHAGVKVYTSKDLRSEQRTTLDSYTLKDMDNPGECKTCDKVVLFKYDMKSPGKPERVCTNPQCLRTKKAKKTRDENKIRSGEDKELTRKLGEIFQNVASERATVLVLVRHLLPTISTAAKVDLGQMIPGLPKLGNGHIDIDSLMVDIESMGISELCRLAVAAQVSERRRRSRSWEKFSTALTPELELDIHTVDGSYDKYAEKVKKWQGLNCRGCGYAKARFIDTAIDCCSLSGDRKFRADGNCTKGGADAVQVTTTPSLESLSPETQAALVEVAETIADKIVRYRALAGIPEDVRLERQVEKGECEDCGLDDEDHSVGMRFSVPSETAGDGRIYLKVCVKDWRAHEKREKQGPVVDVEASAAEKPALDTPVFEREPESKAPDTWRRVSPPAAMGEAGLDKLFCPDKLLSELAGINSAGTLTEAKPRLSGLYELGGRHYACVGSVSSGDQGVISCDLILALPLEEINKIPPGETGYQGRKCRFRGNDYILAGPKILAMRLADETKAAGIEPVDENSESNPPTIPPTDETKPPEHETRVKKKVKEPKAQPAIPCPTADPPQPQIENETKTKTVSSPAPPLQALAPLANAETSELAELQANAEQDGQAAKPVKKNRAGASPLKKDNSPAGGRRRNLRKKAN